MATADNLVNILMITENRPNNIRVEGLQERSARLRASVDSSAADESVFYKWSGPRHSNSRVESFVDPVTFWAALAAVATSIGVSVQVFDRIRAAARHGLKNDALRAITETMTPEQIDELYRSAARIVSAK
jgi:hypothetical protein